MDRCGFADADIELLLDAQATRDTIMARFKALARYAEAQPALFYFGGLGMDTEVGAGNRACGRPRFGSAASDPASGIG